MRSCGKWRRAVSTISSAFSRSSMAMTRACGLRGTRGLEQVVAGGVAVIDLVAELAQRLDLLGVMVEHHGADAAGLQQAAHRHAEAAVAGDDDLGARLLDACRWRAASALPAKRGCMTRCVEDHQQGGRRHGERDHGDEQARLRGDEKGQARREGDQHEGEFAALRQREGEARGIGPAHGEERAPAGRARRA